eukprot:5608746-Prymnesium_polylepis.1
MWVRRRATSLTTWRARRGSVMALRSSGSLRGVPASAPVGCPAWGAGADDCADLDYHEEAAT